MIDQSPPWFNPPTYSIRQTEIFHQWSAVLRERIIQHPPLFLCHLSPDEIRETLATAEKAATMPDTKLTPLLVQILAYKRQVELIAWNHFIAMGRKLLALREKMTRLEFEKTLAQIGLTAEESWIAMAAARLEMAEDSVLS